MFYVYDPSGVRTEYVPGSLRQSRVRLERQLGRVSPVASSDQSAASPEHDGANKQSKGEYVPFPGDAYKEVLEERRQKAVTVSQIMTEDLQTIAPGDGVADVWRMFRNRRFRHMPVVDGTSVVGLVSDRDILPLLSDLPGRPVTAPADLLVKSVMSAPVLTVQPDTSIRSAARVMLQEHVGALPVVSDEDALVGLVTRTDILRAVVQQVPLELWI